MLELDSTRSFNILSAFRTFQHDDLIVILVSKRLTPPANFIYIS